MMSSFSMVPAAAGLASARPFLPTSTKLCPLLQRNGHLRPMRSPRRPVSINCSVTLDPPYSTPLSAIDACLLLPSHPNTGRIFELCKRKDDDLKCSLILIEFNMEMLPAEAREKLVFDKDDYSGVIQQLIGFTSVKEVLVLCNPCNHVFQVYAVVQSTFDGIVDIISWMTLRSGLSSFEFRLNDMFILQNSQAARQLLETAPDGLDWIPDLDCIPELYASSRIHELYDGSSIAELFGGLGVILCDLVAKALSLPQRQLSAAKAIGSAAIEIARNAFAPDCTPLIIGLDDTAQELIWHFSDWPKRLVVVCPDHQMESKLAELCRLKDIPLRPMSELLSHVSEANLIFITSPSHAGPVLFSATDIDSLPAPPSLPHEKKNEKGSGGSSFTRIFIDMCNPPCISAQGVQSARVFNISDILKAMDRRASRHHRQIDACVEEFEIWMKGAINQSGVYTGESSSSRAVRRSIVRDAIMRNLGNRCPSKFLSM